MDLVVQILIAIGITAWIRKALDTANRIPIWDKLVLSKIWLGSIIYFILSNIPGLGLLSDWYWIIIFLLHLVSIYRLRPYQTTRLMLVAALPFALMTFITYAFKMFLPTFYQTNSSIINNAEGITKTWLIGFGIYALIRNNKERKINLKEEEEKRLAEARKLELEQLVTDRTSELTLQKEKLEQTLVELKSTQTQLIQSEKMASLGELTAGIAHEIQNPLNFVNNFSEVSVELLEEMKEELDNGDVEEAKSIADDLILNLEKISHHGKRADGIVKGMLQHSRSSSGKKEPIDINVLADEYLRLAYHGIRAKDKTFNATMNTSFDENLEKINIIPQDIGRVILNLITNAFYAVNEKRMDAVVDYKPTVSVTTKKEATQTIIEISDNGNGIPPEVLKKIFQPFFTTKPTGHGTGLGLSLSYEIVTKGHGGQLKVKTKEGEGTSFIIELPSINQVIYNKD